MANTKIDFSKYKGLPTLGFQQFGQTVVDMAYHEKWKIPELRFFFTGTNLWTPISTFDYKEDAIAKFNSYPLMRTFNFGLGASF